LEDGSVGAVIAAIMFIALGGGSLIALGVRQSGLLSLVSLRPNVALPSLTALEIGLLSMVKPVFGWLAFVVASVVLIGLAVAVWAKR
jgi:hypothetical protein